MTLSNVAIITNFEAIYDVTTNKPRFGLREAIAIVLGNKKKRVTA